MRILRLSIDKYLILFAILYLISINIDAQRYPYNCIQKDMIFNRKELNPVFFHDTALISADAIMQTYLIGPAGILPDYTVSVESYLSKIKSGIGLQANLKGDERMTIRTMELFYNYRILDKDYLKFTVGAGFGLMQYIIDLSEIYIPDDQAPTLEDKANSITTGIGGLLEFRHHLINIGYNDFLIKSEIRNIEGNEVHTEMARFSGGYSYNIRLNNKLNLLPELVYIRCKKDDKVILNTTLLIRNFLSTGVYISPENSYGAHFSCLLWHVLEFGYGCEYELEQSQNNNYIQHIIKAGININRFK
jgi:hypothetical protein